MKKLANLSDLSHDDWLKLRDKGIGGSDVGSILGYNKYKTNIQLWEEKTGIKPNEFIGNEATERGKKSEKPILAMWQAFNNDRVKLIEPQHSYCHSEYDFIRGNFDSFGIVDGEKCIIEVKTAMTRNLKDWREQVPYVYYIQCLHYLLVSGLDTCWLVAGIKLFGYEDIYLKVYKIERKKSEIDYILEEELKFWECIKNKVRPNLIMNVGG